MKKLADLFIEDVLNAYNIIVTQWDTVEEMKYFKKIKSKISFTDISLLYLSEKNKSILVTFDKQLLGLYKKWSL